MTENQMAKSGSKRAATAAVKKPKVTQTRIAEKIPTLKTPVKPKATVKKTVGAIAPVAKAGLSKSATLKKTGAATPVKKAQSSKAQQKPAATEKEAAGKTAVRKRSVKTPPGTKPKMTPEERYRMVQTAAYFIAERNGFIGDAAEHWAAAEREISAELGQ